MATRTVGGGRSRGMIEELPSGSLRVKVYAGTDPVTKRRHYLTETVPAGPQAQKLAEKARTRLVSQVDELMDQHLAPGPDSTSEPSRSQPAQ
ncbi:hypothetical protein [Phytohabitans kaempferiae]|uniref:Uncharacterized protein n=1 Tax=Phytohabitans kaempferiae TaxID=1620943 RepID=A0ABV6MF17_9ACTN